MSEVASVLVAVVVINIGRDATDQAQWCVIVTAELVKSPSSSVYSNFVLYKKHKMAAIWNAQNVG